jgi:hypothetical protein
LARGDGEADQILGLQSVGIGALLHFPIESALDAAKQHGILPQPFVLFGCYRHPRLVGEDLSVLVAWHPAVSSEAALMIRFLFATINASIPGAVATRENSKKTLGTLLIH